MPMTRGWSAPRGAGARGWGASPASGWARVGVGGGGGIFFVGVEAPPPLAYVTEASALCERLISGC